MIFLTFNDKPSGIYTSQVIDVVKLLNEKESTLLVSFVSWRIYKSARKKIKNEYPNTKVYPIIFGLSRWRMCKGIMRLIRKINHEKKCIARGPLAAELALDSGFEKVCYDGRAAMSAEIEEFNVVEGESMIRSFINAEKRAILESDFRIAVSGQLVEYWNGFGYCSNEHVVIPCTLADNFQHEDSEKTLQFKNELNFSEEDIVFVFSGGNAGWNSLERTFLVLEPYLMENKNIKLLLLTSEASYISIFQDKFPNQVFRMWLKHDEVKNYLGLGDYGLLIREDKITNNVASPVKFAEYLALGLNVVISNNIKDYKEFVEKHSCGIVVSDSNEIKITGVNENQKKRNKELAKSYLYKNSKDIIEKYDYLLEKMSI